MRKDALEELLDFFLIADSVVVAEVPPFFILVQAFLLSLPLVPRRRRASIELNLLLSGLQLNVSLEGHVRYHYTNVFRGDVLVVVKIIPVYKT